MLPVKLDGTAGPFAHVRLHNGTIWRWNRPLVGLDEQGRPHLRLEQRVVPSGPTVIDEIANAAFFYGTVTGLAHQERPIESQLEFDRARDNFYQAARLGLRAVVSWLDGKQLPIKELILKQLLPMAAEGLDRLGVASADREQYLGIVHERVAAEATGAHWQRAYTAKHGRDMAALTAAYYERQQSGEPVHLWTV